MQVLSQWVWGYGAETLYLSGDPGDADATGLWTHFELHEFLPLELASAAPEEVAELTPRFRLSTSGLGLKSCISSKLPGCASAPDLEATPGTGKARSQRLQLWLHVGIT